MNKQTIGTAIIGIALGASTVFGLQTQATEVKTFDASEADSVEEVLIERVITTPTVVETVESFTLNDITSDINNIDLDLVRCQTFVTKKEVLVKKRNQFQKEAEVKFKEELEKREEAKRLADEVENNNAQPSE